MLDILPANAGGDDSQGLPSDLVRLVHHEEIRRSSLRPQRPFPMLDRPLQLLHSDQYLPKRCIDLGLPRVETCYRSYGFLVVEDVSA